jgi:hypothetical protein
MKIFSKSPPTYVQNWGIGYRCSRLAERVDGHSGAMADSANQQE